MPFVMALLTALAAIPAIAGYVDKFCQAVMIWYVGRQKAETLAGLADAAALASRANTEEERYAAAQAWRNAMSRPRITPN